MRPLRTWALALIVPVVATGCALDRVGVAKQAQTDLVGKRKAHILSCAGTPDRTRREGDWEYLTYIRMSATDGRQFERARQENPALGRAMERRRYCEATFVLRQDRVQRVNYAGETGGLFTQGEQCGFIVEPCVRE